MLQDLLAALDRRARRRRTASRQMERDRATIVRRMALDEVGVDRPIAYSDVT